MGDENTENTVVEPVVQEEAKSKGRKRTPKVSSKRNRVPEEQAMVVANEPAAVDAEVAPEIGPEDILVVEFMAGQKPPAPEDFPEAKVAPLSAQDVVNYLTDEKLSNPVGVYRGTVLTYKIRSLIKLTFARHANRSTVGEDDVALAELIKPTVALLSELREEQKRQEELPDELLDESAPSLKEEVKISRADLPLLERTDCSYQSSAAISMGTAGSDSDPALEPQEVGPVVGSSMIVRLVKEIKYNVKLSPSQLEELVRSTEFSWPLIPARFDLGDMVALERSIMLSGRILTPITLLQGRPSTEKVKTRGPDLIVDGLRRITALLRLVGQGKIDPGVVTPANVIMPDAEAIAALGRPRVGYLLRILMNLNQKQFNPVEEAAALVRALINTGLPQKDVARLTTCSAEKVRKRAALFGADNSLKEAVAVQVISPENAYALIKDNPTPEGQAAALKRVLAGAPARGLTVGEVPAGGSRLQSAAKRRVQLKDIEGDAPVTAKRARNLLSKISTAYTRWCRSASVPGTSDDDHWDELEALLRASRNLKIAGKLVY